MLVTDNDQQKITQTRRDRFTGDPLSVAHVRLPESVHQRLRAAATAERRSLNDMILVLLEEGLARRA